MSNFEHYVKIPVLAYVTTTIDADHRLTEEEVWDLVKDLDEINAPWDAKGGPDWSWEPVQSVGGGNVYYGEVHDLTIEEVYEDDSDD